MALQNFIDKITVVTAAWLNEVDRLKFTIFGDASTKAEARTALTSDAPLEIVNGGTGARTAADARTNLELGYPLTTEELSVGITSVDITYPVLNVLRYGADSGGDIADAATNQAAFTAAFAYLQKYGGTAIVPEGIYYLSSYVNLDGADGSQANTNYTNIEILGYGATIRNTAGSMAFRIEDNFTPRIVAIRGFLFDQENNSTAYHAIKLIRASCVHISDCTFRAKNNRASYSAINIAPSTPGVDDTNGFWNRIENCVFRPLVGEGSGTWPECYVRLEGQANETQIVGCTFSAATYGVELRSDGVGTGLANSVTIDRCAFEGLSCAVRTLANPAPAYNSTGLKVINSRFELVDIGLSMECRDLLVAPYNHAFPPHLQNNWADGSPITWVYNPQNLYYTDLNPSHYGAFSNQRETIGGSKTFITGYTASLVSGADNRNIIIMNQGGVSQWHSGHLVLGAQHLWYSDSLGTWMTKTGIPTADDDGVPLGGGGSINVGSASGSFTAISVDEYNTPPTMLPVSCKWARTGDIVVIRFGGNDGSLTTGTNSTRYFINMNAPEFPATCIPKVLQRMIAISISNGVWQSAMWEFNPDPYVLGIRIYATAGGGLFPGGTVGCGWPGTTLVYNLVQ